jgi:hypothetical protein
MSFFSAITKFFGLNQEPAKGYWPRVVATNELPPSRIPITGILENNLPFGMREVTAAEIHQGWHPWSPRHQPEPTNYLRHPDLQQMNDHLRDGAVAPPKRER